MLGADECNARGRGIIRVRKRLKEVERLLARSIFSPSKLRTLSFVLVYNTTIATKALRSRDTRIECRVDAENQPVRRGQYVDKKRDEGSKGEELKTGKSCQEVLSR